MVADGLLIGCYWCCGEDVRGHGSGVRVGSGWVVGGLVVLLVGHDLGEGLHGCDAFAGRGQWFAMRMLIGIKVHGCHEEGGNG